VTSPTGPDFVVLTGFLGSGKTTLLRDFLAGPEAADTAVIVNEAGEIGLDGVILREEGSDTPSLIVDLRPRCHSTPLVASLKRIAPVP
jgi:G3E family GTPase